MSFELFATALVAQTFARYEIPMPNDIVTTNLCIREHVTISETSATAVSGTSTDNPADKATAS